MPLVTAEKLFCRKDAPFVNYRGSEIPANQAMQCLLEVSLESSCSIEPLLVLQENVTQCNSDSVLVPSLKGAGAVVGVDSGFRSCVLVAKSDKVCG